MNEMIRQGAVEGFENGMENRGSEVSAQGIGRTTEAIAVDEENKDLNLMIDRLKRSLRLSKITCIVLGVVIAVVIVARLLV